MPDEKPNEENEQQDEAQVEAVEEAPEAETAEPEAEAPSEEPAAEEPAEEPAAEEPADEPAEEEPAAEEAATEDPVAEAQREPIVRLPKPEHARGRSQERRGVVVSDAMDKTIVVKVDTVKAHRKYKKVVRRSTKFHAHDEQNAAKVGDLVRIVETRPFSKTKNWRLAEVLEEAK